MHRLRQQNSTTYPIPIYLVSSTDHVTPVSGVTPTVSLRKNLGTAAAATGTATSSDSAGVSKFTQSSTDVNTLGPLILEVSATGCDSYEAEYTVVAFDPFNVLPSANAGAPQGLATFNIDSVVPSQPTNYGGNPIPSDVNGNMVVGVSTNYAFTFDISGLPIMSVGGYESNQSPDYYILQTPGQKVKTNASGFVYSYDTSGNALATASALSTLQTSVNNQNNLSALAVLYVPGQMEIPASGSIAYVLILLIKDEEGHMLDLSASPTVTATDAAGTDRSTNLSSVTHAGTGQYTLTYTVSSAAVQESVYFKATGTASSDSTSRIAMATVAIVADDTTSTLAAIEAQTNKIGTNNADSPNEAAAQTTIATNLNATVSSRSTYAGTDTAGTTTLLSRLPQALLFDGSGYAKANSEVVGDKTGYSLATAPPTAAAIATAVLTDTADLTTAGSLGYLVGHAPTWYSAPGTPPTAAAIATQVWTDATSGDFNTAGTPGYILAKQLGGIFVTNTSSVITAAALVNAPSGGGGGGGTVTVNIQDAAT